MCPLFTGFTVLSKETWTKLMMTVSVVLYLLVAARTLILLSSSSDGTVVSSCCSYHFKHYSSIIISSLTTGSWFSLVIHICTFLSRWVCNPLNNIIIIFYHQSRVGIQDHLSLLASSWWYLHLKAQGRGPTLIWVRVWDRSCRLCSKFCLFFFSFILPIFLLIPPIFLFNAYEPIFLKYCITILIIDYNNNY